MMNVKMIFQLIVIICLGHLHVDASSSSFTSPLRSDALGSSIKSYLLNKPSEITPFSRAPPFTLDTLDKGFVTYPSAVLPANVSIGFHAFTKNSGFLEGLWHNIPTLAAFIKSSPSSVNYIFLSFDQNATSSAIFMQSQLINAMNYMKLKENKKSDFLNRCFFSLAPVFELGNWIVTLLDDWACQGHGCGYDQITFRSKSWDIDFKVLKRLDARYDWDWSHSWKDQLHPVIYGHDVCHLKSDRAIYNQSVVLVDDNESKCTIAEKATILEHGGALGVIVFSAPGMPVKEINCRGAECSAAISIPVTSIPYNGELVETVQTTTSGTVVAQLQTSPSPNFFFSIDSFGRLVEFGWALYPSLEFLGWQMQWLVYQQNLFQRISTLNDYVVTVFDSTTMTGHNGTGSISVTLNGVRDYDELYLDASLSCEGNRDEDCPPWDHVASLYVCCDGGVLCNTEIGRWITPFRRRIGRWLTNISPLLPIFHNDTQTSKCTFVMKSDAWWAKPWVPSLSLRFRSTSSLKPFHVEPLFEGGTFDNSYNMKYKPHVFVPPTKAKLVKIVAVISGHGSDDNQCGEFCVTSHQFTVNSNFKHVISFDDAGSPLGCTKLVPKGAIPNEHGTWLYGRGGWCDGMQVEPWVIDITREVQLGQANKVTYRGLFKGRDPNPKQNPGLIRLTSFLVFYR